MANNSPFIQVRYPLLPPPPPPPPTAGNEINCSDQHFVCPSLAAAAALILLRIDFTNAFLLSALGCYSNRPPKHFLTVRGWGIPMPPYPSVQIVPKALWGTNLDCMVDSPVGRCYCLPENLDKLWPHVAGYIRRRCCTRRTATGRRISSLYPVSCDFTPCAVPPNHNGDILKPIPFVNASIGEAFPATSL